MTLPRALSRALTFIKRYIRDNSCPPSLGDISRDLRISRQRAHELVRGLERVGEITRTPGVALSIRLVEPLENLSDDEFLHDLGRRIVEAERRGIFDRTAIVGTVLSTAYFGVYPLGIRESG